MSAPLVLHPDDDVAVVVGEHPAAPQGHKVARRDIAAGETVHKYGQIIGVATATITAGEHVHTHNLAMVDGDRAAAGTPREPARPPAGTRTTFDGYRRASGRVGTRNHIGVLATVNCSSTVVKQIAARAAAELPDGVDGVVALAHGTGCGMADGAGLELLRRTLRGYARHPNLAGVLLVGLGCEVNQLADLDLDVPAMTIQELGGTARTVAEGVRLVHELAAAAAGARREPVPVAELVLGLQCGGSDGWSGLTANPALGVASDLLVAAGGTSILGETPEIYGAEHLLTARASTPDVARAVLDRIDWWRDYTATNGATMDANPSPGNKDGGITTILEKSLGAVAKAGAAPLRAVYEFAEPVTERGLVFMDTPGYDPVSVTGMVAGGATVVCFTTGRGSVFGCKPVPSLKLATNSALYERMRDDMDLDCGGIADGRETVAAVGQRIYDAVLDTASGRPTASEQLGFGDEEFAPWQLGAVM